MRWSFSALILTAWMASVTVCRADPPAAAWNPAKVSWLATSVHHYVAPNGKSGNQGTLASPWDLASVLAGMHTVAPGDVVWLRGGTYGAGGTQAFTNALSGSAAKPIIIRQMPGERATINGRFSHEGSYTWLWGVEICNTSTDRISRPGASITGRGSRWINVVLHDVGHAAPGFWRGVGDGGELYGVIMWANGFYDPATGGSERGSMYAQNETGTRYITDNIAFRNFTIGIYCGSAVSAKIDGFRIEGNVSFDHPWWNIFMRSENYPMQRSVIVGNYCWSRKTDMHNSTLQLGYDANDNESVEVRNNYFVMGNGGYREFYLMRWKGCTVTGNTLISPKWLANFLPAASATTRTWNNNKYYGGSTKPFVYDGIATNFAGWKAVSGFDSSSTWSSAYPTGVKVFVRPNQYEPGRGHVVVYNWDKNPTVEVNVSSILKVGQTFKVLDAQNYFGTPVKQGTYDGRLLTLPMNMTTVANAIGDVHHIQDRFVHTAPEFAVFVVTTDGRAFLPPQGTYPLTVNSGSGDGSYAAETVVSITADVPPAGKVFDGWTIDSGSPSISNVDSSSTTLTMPASAATVTATYRDWAEVPFTAYNDLSWATGQITRNITRYTTASGGAALPEGSRGPLKDCISGKTVPVSVSITGGVWDGKNLPLQGPEPAQGTDAYGVFNGKVNCLGVISYGEPVVLIFTGLEPEMQYEIVLFENRGNYDGSRESTFTISDVAAFLNESSSGTGVNPTDASVTISAMNTSRGYVARYTGIDGGPDGDARITVTGTLPYVNAFMLKATASGGTSGDSDGDGMSDTDEVLAGTNPNDRNDVMAISESTPVSGTQFTLRWTSVAGRTYRIMGGSDLTTGLSDLIKASIAATAPTNRETLTIGQDRTYYRIELQR